MVMVTIYDYQRVPVLVRYIAHLSIWILGPLVALNYFDLLM